MPDFVEEQRFRQPWVWLILMLPTVVVWYGFVAQIVMGREFGDRPAADWVVVALWLVVGLLLPWFMWSLTLVTRVDDSGVHIRFRPLPREQHFPYDSIARAEGGSYRPIREFGGWGIRWGRQGKRAYSVAGSSRVELHLSSGRRWTIGTQRPEELSASIAARLGRL